MNQYDIYAWIIFSYVFISYMHELILPVCELILCMYGLTERHMESDLFDKLYELAWINFIYERIYFIYTWIIFTYVWIKFVNYFCSSCLIKFMHE